MPAARTKVKNNTKYKLKAWAEQELHLKGQDYLCFDANRHTKYVRKFGCYSCWPKQSQMLMKYPKQYAQCSLFTVHLAQLINKM